MTEPTKKRTSPAVVFLGVFVAIIVVMFVVNKRSALERELYFPFNNGIQNLSTYGNRLSGVSRDNKMYLWSWDDLSHNPQVCPVASAQAMLLKSDRIVSLGGQASPVLTVSSLDGEQKYGQIPVGWNEESATYLAANTDRSVIVILYSSGQPLQGTKPSYELVSVDLEAARLRPIIRVGSQTSVTEVRDIVLSDTGRLAAIAGQKDGQGWLAVVDVEKKVLVWQKELAGLKLFFNSVFSPDGRFIYARASDCTVYKFDAAGGDVLETLSAVKQNQSMVRNQHVQLVTISPDGRLVAASIGKTIHVWDCESGRKVLSKEPEHKLIGGMAFSPDCRLLASCDFRQGGVIEIWKMPKR